MIGRTQPPVHSPLTLKAILRAGSAAALGASVAEDELRDQLRATFAAPEVLLSDSGTSALALALEAVGRDAAIAMPAYSCYNLATAADAAQRPVLLYDVDPHTLGPDLTSLRAALSTGARAVVVAPLFGMPMEMAPIEAMCSSAGAILIEDAAQHAGATVAGRRVGSFGDLTILSFGRGKGVTGGSGGALLGRGEVGAGAIRRVATRLGLGRAGVVELPKLLAQWSLARPSLYAIPSSLPFLNLGETIYHRPWRPRAISRAAVGALAVTRQLADDELSVRRRHADALHAALDGQRAVAAIAASARAEPGYLRLPVFAALEARPRMTSQSARRLGVMPGYPKSLADLEGFIRRVRNAGDPFPGARSLAERLFTLPTHSLLRHRDLEQLVSWLRELGTSG